MRYMTSNPDPTCSLLKIKQAKENMEVHKVIYYESF